MNWTLLANLTQAALAQLPSMVKLGVDLAGLIPELKKSVEAIAGSGTITADDAARMRTQIAEAEAGWADQVRQAQEELDAEKKTS